MESIVILVVGVLVLLIALPIIAIVLARQAAQRLNEVTQTLAELTHRFNRLDQELKELRKPGDNRAPERAAVPSALPAKSPAATPEIRAQVQPDKPAAVFPELPQAAKGFAPPPVLAPSFEAKPVPLPVRRTSEPELATASAGAPPAPAIERPAINWEQFLGVKLFAWVGGLALFLGVAFLVKYSFEQGLISPPIRVALGFVIGLGLLVGGLLMSRKKYAPTVQALCSAGLLILYADVFAACAFYHFLPETVAFLCMVLVTATAFALAVRLDAPAVAILALLGGFLTPPLLSTGKDNPVGLFGYLAILDVGLIAVAFRKRWCYLLLLAAIATIVMQAGWVHKFFEVQKAATAMIVFLGFTWLFVLALGRAHQTDQVGVLHAVFPVALERLRPAGTPAWWVQRGAASWVRSLSEKPETLVIRLSSPITTDTLVLEMDNGDNPPLELGKVQAFYPATRLLFKAAREGDLFLYYGNPRAEFPRYDIDLVASQLLPADKTRATLGQVEPLQKPGWAGRQSLAGATAWIFWSVLAGVVVVLLLVISRLLPKKS